MAALRIPIIVSEVFGNDISVVEMHRMDSSVLYGVSGVLIKDETINVDIILTRCITFRVPAPDDDPSEQVIVRISFFDGEDMRHTTFTMPGYVSPQDLRDRLFSVIDSVLGGARDSLPAVETGISRAVEEIDAS